MGAAATFEERKVVMAYIVLAAATFEERKVYESVEGCEVVKQDEEEPHGYRTDHR